MRFTVDFASSAEENEEEEEGEYGTLDAMFPALVLVAALPVAVMDMGVGTVVVDEVEREGEAERVSGERGVGELDGDMSMGLTFSLCRAKAASGVSPWAT